MIDDDKLMTSYEKRNSTLEVQCYQTSLKQKQRQKKRLKLNSR